MKKTLLFSTCFLVFPLLFSCSSNTLKVETNVSSYHVGDFIKYSDFKVTNNNKEVTDFLIYNNDELVIDGSAINDLNDLSLTFKKGKYTSKKYEFDVFEKEKRNVDYKDFTYYDLGINASLPSLPSKGDLNVLVIPLCIKGFEKNATSENLEKIKLMFNGDSTNTNFESVSSFYLKSSYNQLKLDFTVSDWFNLNKDPLEIYMERDRNDPSDSGIMYCMDQALNWYKETYNDDCTKFDNDKDGLIDAVWFINSARNYLNYNYDSRYASTYWGFTYWNKKNYNLRNIYNPTYMNFSWCTFDFMFQGYGINGIDAHTFIHETGHLLGLIDYYDTYNYKLCPNGNIDMMDFNIGDHLAFSKFSLGWIEPKIVNSSTTINIKPLESSGEFIVIGGNNYNKGAFDEYFIVEYVTPTGLNEKDYLASYNNVDRKIKGYSKKGIKITHIDNRGAKEGNVYNNLVTSTDEINVNYLTNTSAINPKYNQNPMLLSTIFPANYSNLENSTTNPINGKYKESDEALFFENQKFELNETSIYTSLMPSNSNKLNKYLVSKINEDILDFSVEVLSLNEEATLKIEVKNNEKQSI